jgi:hypothetical protein
MESGAIESDYHECIEDAEIIPQNEGENRDLDARNHPRHKGEQQTESNLHVRTLKNLTL